MPTSSPRSYYSRNLLHSSDAFELWPLDGGAFFFLNEHLGEATGNACLAALLDGRLLSPWKGSAGNIDWDRAWDEPGVGPLNRPIEKHVWLNRLYFLLPLALEFVRSRDANMARLWARYFRKWARAHPFPTAYGHPATASKYIWFDMQVAWRLNILTHSTFLLAGSVGMTGRNGQIVRKAIMQHADLLCHEAERRLAQSYRGPQVGNHFLQKATVLLQAGVLVPELVDAQPCCELGVRALQRHLQHDTLADGGNVERSPSYSHFIARLYLDALRLLRLSGRRPPAGLARAVARQYSFLAETAGPDGRSLQINDAYAMDAARDLELVRNWTTLSRTGRKSRLFAKSALATVRSDRFDVYMDAAPATLYHHHNGKPNLLAFADGFPLLIDPGNCNYDRQPWRDWYASAAAHNTVLITPEGANAPVAPDQIRLLPASDDRILTETRCTTDSLVCLWRRRVETKGNRLIVTDRVTANQPVTAQLILQIGTGDVVVREASDRAEIFLGGRPVHLLTEGKPASPLMMAFRPTIDRQNQMKTTAELSRTAFGKEFTFRSTFALT